ncbi:MAG: hypothetical protein H0U76_12695 [Ktedonobacteraceae bacterium]|nr:hypothetical protein [Ktedonobacteraceae bacterium]
MSVSEELKSLAERIEASYEPRREAVADLTKETHEMLGNFDREHEEMTRDLQQELATFRQEHEEMTRDLKQSLATFQQERKQEFATLIGEIKGEITAIEKDTAGTLADFSADHRQAHSNWEHLAKVMATKRAGKKAPALKAKTIMNTPIFGVGR